MKSIVKMLFGSHLYGTETPKSDMDYKGVFLPDKRDLLLGKVPKSVSSNTKQGNGKNSQEDIDTEIYSLSYFIHLACEGETVALDMLHAPENMLVKTGSIWNAIVSNRERFYTKNLKAFIGYARRQASKYGVKGSRLNDAKKVLDYIASVPSQRMIDIWDKLPEGEHIHKNENVIPRTYEVCGRQIQETATTMYGYDIVKRFYASYGARAEQASKNMGIDWKAVSHALRAAYQAKQILTEGTIVFPLKEANFLKQVKAGELDYSTLVSPLLDELISEVGQLSEKSTLPMEVDRKYWDDFIVSVMEEYVI